MFRTLVRGHPAVKLAGKRDALTITFLADPGCTITPWMNTLSWQALKHS
jgi:hypothetical protein